MILRQRNEISVMVSAKISNRRFGTSRNQSNAYPVAYVCHA
jgi:hypothetical protein